MLGGLDWLYSTIGMCTAAVVCIGITLAFPSSLYNVWVALAAFMATQVHLNTYINTLVHRSIFI
jgi:hypothetical protein